MYSHKLLLVDDEYMVRTGLKKVIENLDGNWQLVGEATNGEEGLMLIKQYQPDLIISDIRMPKMDGLTLLQKSKELHPESMVILLTGYPEFEYAQQALRNGALDYILKPTKAEDIIKVLKKAESLLIEQKQEKQEKQDLHDSLNHYNKWITEKAFRNLLYGGHIGNIDISHKDEWGSETDIVVITIVQNKPLSLGQRVKILEELTKNLFSKELEIIVLPDAQDEILLLVVGEKEEFLDWDSLKEKLHALRIKCAQNHQFFWKAGVGGQLSLMAEASLSYHQSKKAVHYSKPDQLIIHYHDILDFDKDPSIIPFELELSLVSAIKLGRKGEVKKSFDQLTVYFEHMMFKELNNYVNSLLVKITNSLLIKYESNSLSFPNPSAVQEWFYQQVMQCFVKVNEREIKEKNYIIERAKKMIAERYDCDLTLKNVAVDLSINPSYLSVLFKQETGETFSEYLVSYRYQVAKELLENPRLKIYEIAEQVGYVNGRYFSQMFKRNSGLTPKQYRNQLEITISD
ncbi:response regulator [Gracilibacillus phocaeensis]|uniref:response regulator n=1 Tax=Gracilibacillus phocaeensis TaxID=2042304 RepID=UPI001031DEEE|nr:response regulator [Gracilibacillus phocaeensis]